MNGVCGTAHNKTYLFTDTSYGADTFCSAGTRNPNLPAFPAPGFGVIWSCDGLNGGANIPCIAYRSTELTPPVTTFALTQVSVTGYTWTGSATIDEAGTGYCTALATGSPAPTAAEVKANNNANKVGTGGTITMTAYTTANCQVTGLFANTTYDFYFVAEDISTNLQLDAAVSGPVIATTLDPLISSLVFTDLRLDDCVNTSATVSRWTTVSQMTKLLCVGGVQSIAGIEQLTALDGLVINSTFVRDLTPLAGLTALTMLELTFNDIVDVTPLAGLTALTDLNLSNNAIGGQLIGRVDLLSPAVGASIFLTGNFTMSCGELATLLANPNGYNVDVVVNPGLTCTNP